MNKIMRLFAVVIALAVITSCCVVYANAEIAPQIYGDLDNDNVVDITDATVIQMYLAKKATIHTKHLEAADVNQDSKITVLDATMIQMYLAGYDVDFPYNDRFSINQYIFGVIPDHESGKAMAGTAVNFKVDGYSDPGPTTVKLYVDGEMVAETDKKNDTYEYELSHTFEHAGTYRLVISVCDKWGYGLSWVIEEYVVVDAVEDTSKPIITSIRRDSLISRTPTITATAQFGTQPYEYKFVLEQTWFIPEEFEGIVKKTQDFSEDNTFDVELEMGALYKVTVTVRDADGNEVTESSLIEVNMVDPA